MEPHSGLAALGFVGLAFACVLMLISVTRRPVAVCVLSLGVALAWLASQNTPMGWLAFVGSCSYLGVLLLPRVR